MGKTAITSDAERDFGLFAERKFLSLDSTRLTPDSSYPGKFTNNRAKGEQHKNCAE